MNRICRVLVAIIIIAYVLIGIVTLSNYGVNWDESSHLTRGQAYLYYFLTGKKQYDESFLEGRHSFYQIQQFNFVKQMRIDGDHPALSDILSSLSNYVFYQKLAVLGDFESYHLYGVVLVGLFLIFLYWWVEKYYGGFAGLVTIISLVTYPLFYGESHFNVQKDIPEAVYRTVTALFFYEALRRKSVKWMIATGIAFGFAFGTKLNVVFLFPIFVLYIFLIRKSIPRAKTRWKLFLYAILSLGIGIAIYIGSWPWLWQNPIGNIAKSLGYYKQMGILSAPDLPPQYYIGFIKTYAVQWIAYTTPLVTLFLTSIGVFIALRSPFVERYRTNLYIFLLFISPIARVSLANASIYGGVRQIMEYIPAMSILSGIGAKVLLDKFKHHRLLVQIVVIASFIPITLRMISMHPNESVYFNPLIGGLKGAAARNIPGWGNSLGSAYRQGVRWINSHAEDGAKVAFAYELMSSIPRTELRPDIDFSNTYRSGPKQEGEYIIGVTHESDAMGYFNYRYVNRYLKPVYQVVVDGVPILKVWKNDPQHTNPEFFGRTGIIKDVQVKSIGDKVILEFPHIVELMKLTILFKEDNCQLPENGQLFMSTDGQVWIRVFSRNLLDGAPYHWFNNHPQKGKLNFLFADDFVRYLKITENSPDSCLQKYPVSIEAEGIE